MELKTIREVCRTFHLSERAVRRWAKEGKLPVTEAGNRQYINVAWLAEKLARDGKL